MSGHDRYGMKHAVLCLLTAFAIVLFVPDSEISNTPGMADASAVTAIHDARECVALAAFTEARSEGVAGMAAVVEVVRNRSALNYGIHDSACFVVFQPNQFIGVQGWTVQRADHTDSASWGAALAIADMAMGGADLVPPPCRGALYFNQSSARRNAICRIGAHNFYRMPP